MSFRPRVPTGPPFPMSFRPRVPTGPSLPMSGRRRAPEARPPPPAGRVTPLPDVARSPLPLPGRGGVYQRFSHVASTREVAFTSVPPSLPTALPAVVRSPAAHPAAPCAGRPLGLGSLRLLPAVSPSRKSRHAAERRVTVLRPPIRSRWFRSLDPEPDLAASLGVWLVRRSRRMSLRPLSPIRRSLSPNGGNVPPGLRLCRRRRWASATPPARAARKPTAPHS